MIIYFTGTENSKWAAEQLGRLLDDELVDSRPLIRSAKSGDFRSEKAFVFVSPTYSWQMPSVFQDFLRKSSFQGNTKAYLLLTCGSDTGNASAFVARFFQEIHLDYQGLCSLVMPENYLALFPVPNREEAVEIMKKALPHLEEAASCIREEKPFSPKKRRFGDRTKSSLIHNFFFAHIVKAKPFYVTDRCVGCGHCAEACVLHNIDMEEGRPLWGAHCTHCMACICGCPCQAIEYGKKTQGKERYWCPDYDPHSESVTE